MSNAVVVIEPDRTSGREVPSSASRVLSAVVVLSLGVLGSTVLPVPYAFEKLGVFGGCFTAALVAFVNDLTCCWLIRAASLTGRYTYEGLSEYAGGWKAKRVSQLSLLLLLFGTVAGGMGFLADMGKSMATIWARGLSGAETDVDGSSTQTLLRRLLASLQDDGRPIMVAVVLFVLYPLSLRRHIRELERAATLGVVVVLVLVGLIVMKAVSTGMPAIRDGELPLGWGTGGLKSIPEGFAILGFAFYMQPFLLPLLKEMPDDGPRGIKLSETAVHIVLWGVACGVYGSMGLFGAATYGASTQSNIMLNDVLGNAPVLASLALYGSLLLYLCTGMVTSVYALRASVEVALMGENATFVWGRWVVVTTVLQAACLAVAYTFPTAAEKIFAITGCTAVCIVCYCVPVFIHLQLKSRLHKAALASGGTINTTHTKPLSHEEWTQRGGDAPLRQPLLHVVSTDPAGSGVQQHSDASHSEAPVGNDRQDAHETGVQGEQGTQGEHSQAACLPEGCSVSGQQEQSSQLQGSLHAPSLPESARQRRGSHEQGASSGVSQTQGGREWCALDRYVLYDPHRPLWKRVLSEWLLPVLVVLVGVACSVAGLWVAVKDIIDGS